MVKTFFVSSIAVVLLMLSPFSLGESPWGEDYFPNTELTTHDGEQVNFFDDLVKDKIVAINFIYTSCPDVCPLETAQLTRVQKILGDKLGKDVHFYSISIDPEHDTPAVLKDYRDRFRAKWTFLTGDKQEIIKLRRALGLYVDGVDDGPNKNNHNVSMIIGNQSTGRWMRRSPFENPHVLADQLGNWLTSWKPVQTGEDYSHAPELRSLSQGESLFRTRCSSCHSVDGVEEADDIGPDLLTVTKRRDQEWLRKWMLAPDKMIAEKDPLALSLLKKYNNLAMPNLRLNHSEVEDLMVYMAQLQGTPATKGHAREKNYRVNNSNNLVAVNDEWLREAHPGAKVMAGYMTLENIGEEKITLLSASSADFETVEFHEMSMEDGFMKMEEIRYLNIGAGETANFVPGGKHFMFNNPKRTLVDGDQIFIELVFGSNKKQKIILPVKRGR